MQRLKAFTLVEIIVVVAIVAILMALLFPVLAKAKQSATVTQDIQQMRQVYMAVMLYEQDASEASPHSLVYTSPYASSKDIYSSPVDPFRNGIPGVKDFPADMYNGDGPRSPFRISYGYLYPMAIFDGETEQWFKDQRSTPSCGLISMKMYNDVFPIQNPPGEIDLWRKNRTAYRIRMDGSFQEWHEVEAVSNSCSLNFCFGPDWTAGSR